MTIKIPTKDAIIMAAFDLYRINPKASLGEIAEYAGIGRATLHRHFPSREDLAVELATVALKELDEAAEKATEHARSHTEAIKLMLFALVPLADRQWFLLREDLEGNQQLEAEYSRQTSEMHELIEQVKNEGGFSPDMPTAWIAELYDGILMSAWEHIRQGQATSAQACELAWQSLMNGVGRQDGH